MGLPLIQPTFTGGELSPSLYARVDLARYGTSLRTAKNFLVRPYGGVSNRPGLGYCGAVESHARRGRLIPFVYSTEVAYVVELGHLVARFWVAGAQLVDGGSNPVEVFTPWGEEDLQQLAFTQSADRMYLAHPDYPTQVLTRTSSTSFALAPYVSREGPFGDLNIDEAVYMTASAQVGVVTLTTNAAVFEAGHVGALVYLEQKELTQIKPWTAGERNITVGMLRRSDGKTYKAVTAETGGNDWVEAGTWRPTHEAGRAWDGGQDVRDNTVQSWQVGVEWEYQDSGYGIVLITGFTSSTQVTGEVVRQIPAACVGGIGTPGTTWTLSGDGTTKVFPVVGAVSGTQSDYTVTIGGVPVQGNPYYTPPAGSGPNGPGQEAAP